MNGLSVNWVTKNYKSSNKAKIVKGLFKREDDNLINYLRDSSKKSEKQFLDRELKKLEVQAKKSIR